MSFTPLDQSARLTNNEFSGGEGDIEKCGVATCRETNNLTYGVCDFHTKYAFKCDDQRFNDLMKEYERVLLGMLGGLYVCTRRFKDEKIDENDPSIVKLHTIDFGLEIVTKELKKEFNNDLVSNATRRMLHSMFSKMIINPKHCEICNLGHVNVVHQKQTLFQKLKSFFAD